MEKQNHGNAKRDSAIPPRPEERGLPRSLMMFINDIEGIYLEHLTALAVYGDKVNVLVEDGAVYIQHKVGLGLKALYNPLSSDKIAMKLVDHVLLTRQYEIRPFTTVKVCVSNHRMDGYPVNIVRSGKYVRGVGNTVVEACCRALVMEEFGDDLGRMIWEEPCG